MYQIVLVAAIHVCTGGSSSGVLVHGRMELNVLLWPRYDNRNSVGSPQ